MKPAKFGLSTATALVIANMVGTGVFTSLGFQVAGLSSGLALLMLWGLGGLIAPFIGIKLIDILIVALKLI